MTYLCTRFRLITKASVLKKSLKNLSKRFGGLRKRFYLCTTFRFEKAGGQDKRVLSKIRIKFFEDIEQLSKFFLSRKREISNNTFEIRAKIYIQNFLQWRV